MRPLTATLAPLAAAALLAACATGPTGPDARTATIQRTANGVPHISAPDPETLAYAMAYAYAQDNVCMTADQLVTVRGERARWFGGATPGLLARRMFPNEQIDLFIAAHMDDAALERAWMGASAESQAMARGAVAGYNRYLSDAAGKLPAACNSQPWVKPMTLAEFRRQGELTAVQAATAALAGGLSPKIVSDRLGHASVSITLDTYSHVLPAMDEHAAAVISGLVLPSNVSNL